MTAPALPGWAQRCSSVAAFLVPGLSLAAPSGYSFGAALLLLAALATLPHWARQRPAPATLALALSFVAMAALWLSEGLGFGGVNWLDRPLKFLLAVPCLLFLAQCAPQPRWLAAGVLVGAVGACLTALLQWHGCQSGWTGWALFATKPCEVVTITGRVSGYTNAIQFGDLALLLGVFCLCALWALWARWSVVQRCAWVVGAAMGFEASLLSMARGGWLALALALPFVAVVLLRWGGRRAALALGAGLLMLATLAAFKGDEVAVRMREAVQEWRQYQSEGRADSSIGHRVAHGRLAWDMARERPWTGWTQAGYEREKARRVAAGQAPPVVLEYGHAHNEVLDMLAKRGVLGLAVLLAFYLVPLACFWPTRARVGHGTGTDRSALALRMAGCLLVLCYAGFGLTQVFLAHNSGVIFYLFMAALLHAALLARGRVGDAARSERPVRSGEAAG